MSGHKLIVTKAGNRVKSKAEAKVDDFFHDMGYHPIYEPIIEIEGGLFTPDWVLLPQKELTKPVIVEYWGLLRKGNRADWVIKRLPQYIERKEIKETVYCNDARYDFLGIYPEDLKKLKKVFTKFLNNGIDI